MSSGPWDSCSKWFSEGKKLGRSSGSITDLWVLSRWGNAVPNPKETSTWQSARWLRFPGQFVWAQILPLCTTVWPPDKLHHPSGPQFPQTKNKDNSDSISSLVVWNPVSSCLANSAAINMETGIVILFTVIYLTFSKPQSSCRYPQVKVLQGQGLLKMKQNNEIKSHFLSVWATSKGIKDS